MCAGTCSLSATETIEDSILGTFGGLLSTKVGPGTCAPCITGTVGDSTLRTFGGTLPSGLDLGKSMPKEYIYERKKKYNVLYFLEISASSSYYLKAKEKKSLI